MYAIYGKLRTYLILFVLKGAVWKCTVRGTCSNTIAKFTCFSCTTSYMYNILYIVCSTSSPWDLFWEIFMTFYYVFTFKYRCHVVHAQVTSYSRVLTSVQISEWSIKWMSRYRKPTGRNVSFLFYCDMRNTKTQLMSNLCHFMRLCLYLWLFCVNKGFLRWSASQFLTWEAVLRVTIWFSS